MTHRFRKRTTDEINFEREVARALDQLPEWVRIQLANVAIIVEEEPTLDEQDYGGALYAVYDGASVGMDAGPFALPSRIVLFRRPLIADFGRGTRLRREIRRTIVHEIAHHFGMSEEDIAMLGYS